MRPAVPSRSVLFAVAALSLAACGAAGNGPGPARAAQPAATAAGADPPGQRAPSPSPAPGAGPGEAAGPGVAGPAARSGTGSGAPASAPAGAAPGDYPIQVSTSSQSSGVEHPGAVDETDVLSIGSPTAVAAGASQQDSITTADGHVTVLTLVYAPSGAVLLGGVAQPGRPAFAPDPAVQLVPASADAAPWQGSFRLAGGGGGTWSGSITGRGSQRVGGATVATWSLQGRGAVSGSYRGAPYSGSLEVSAEWAPSLHLFSTLHAVLRGGPGPAAAPPAWSSTLDGRLLATRPR